MYDIQQVEVLRGPQSARYGASALAGVIYMRSQDPTAERTTHAELTAGNDGLVSIAASAGGSLSQNLDGRLSVQHFASNGFRDNVYLDRNDTGGRQEFSARGKLRWAFANDWEALLTGMYMDFDNGYDAWTVDNSQQVHSDRPC